MHTPVWHTGSSAKHQNAALRQWSANTAMQASGVTAEMRMVIGDCDLASSNLHHPE